MFAEGHSYRDAQTTSWCSEGRGAIPVKLLAGATQLILMFWFRPQISLFERLPTDLFVHIVSFLSQSDLIRATHVCQRWRTVLTAQPLLWQALDLRFHNSTRYTSEGVPTQLHVWLQRLSGASLVQLTTRISNATSSAAAAIQTAHTATLRRLVEGSHLQSLRVLRISGLGFSPSALQGITTKAGNSLLELDWDLQDRHPNMEPSALLSSFPNLRMLRLGFRRVNREARLPLSKLAMDGHAQLRNLSMLLTRDVTDTDSAESSYGCYRNLETSTLR